MTPAAGQSGTATINDGFLTITGGSSGTGDGTVSYSVAANSGSATRMGTLSIADQTFTVNLSLQSGTPFVAPFGQVDTPAQNATGVVGAIGVTGWALDDLGVSKVEVFRNCLPFDAPAPGGTCQGIDGQNVVFVGTAAFLPGARPDLEPIFPTIPQGNIGGWGYLVLTNLLGRANQTDFTPTAITMANEGIVKPFGAIDTPGQGETISGAAFANFGWALTPDSDTEAGAWDILVPTDGSTSFVFIDELGRETGRYKFPENPPSGFNQTVLVATQAFAALPGARSDHVANDERGERDVRHRGGEPTDQHRGGGQSAVRAERGDVWDPGVQHAIIVQRGEPGAVLSRRLVADAARRGGVLHVDGVVSNLRFEIINILAIPPVEPGICGLVFDRGCFHSVGI